MLLTIILAFFCFLFHNRLYRKLCQLRTQTARRAGCND